LWPPWLTDPTSKVDLEEDKDWIRSKRPLKLAAVFAVHTVEKDDVKMWIEPQV